MKKLCFLILSLLELPFLIFHGLIFFWMLICKTISTFFFPFVIFAIVTMPITFINGIIITSIIYIKNNIVGNHMNFSQAGKIHLSRFPEL